MQLPIVGGFLLLSLTGALTANPFVWTGAGGDGEWTNSDNWDPVPNFSASNSTQNGYEFIFKSDQQRVQNLGHATGVEETTRRYSRLEFANYDYVLNSPYGRLLLGSGAANRGIFVDGVTVDINVKQFDFNVFTLGSSGEISATNGGQLNLSASESFQIAGSQLRTLNLAGDGTITLSGSLQTGENGGGILLKHTLSGTVELNTSGSTIDKGNVVHRGTGTLGIGADDAIGSLGIVFENAQARIAARHGPRTLSAAVQTNQGFILAGSNAMIFAGGVNLNSSTVTVGVEETIGRLVFAGDIEGPAEVFVKTGAGTLELSTTAAASFDKSLLVAEGVVVTDELVIHSNQWLGGSGRVAGLVSIDGQLRLQNSEGLTFSDHLHFSDGSSIAYQPSAGPVSVEGDLDFNGGVRVVLDETYEWQIGHTYRLFELEDGVVSGTLIMDGVFQGNFSYQSGEQGYVEFELTAIPEPYHAAVLLSMIVFGLVTVRQMRRR